MNRLAVPTNNECLGVGTLRVLSVNGAEVFRQSLGYPSGTVSWQPVHADLDAGIYFYQLLDTSGKQVDQGKVILQYSR